ncbi:MAG: hypothetical protein ACJ8BW_26735 [Ktedonobacteraceae bacterium]|jgi:hypothetical protein
MPTKLQIAAGVTALGTAYGLGAYRSQRKYVKALQIIDEVEERRTSLAEQLRYLVNVLNEHRIVLDEFDLIVLKSVMQV